MSMRWAVAALLLLGCDQQKDREAGRIHDTAVQPKPNSFVEAPGISLPSIEATLRRSNSSVSHLRNLQHIARCMIGHQYLADDRGTPLTEQIASAKMTGGVSHIYPRKALPYRMEWRLMLFGGEAENDLPTSFLKAQCDRPFTHDVAVDVVKEFCRVASLAPRTSQVTEAMRSAETKFRRVRRGGPNQVTSWFVSSDLGDGSSIREAGHEYAVRVDIREWPRQEYICEEGACRVTVYFVYLPPHKQIDLSQVTKSGF